MVLMKTGDHYFTMITLKTKWGEILVGGQGEREERTTGLHWGAPKGQAIDDGVRMTLELHALSTQSSQVNTLEPS